ncbi:MAG: acyl-CoA dehydrogenase family protein [Candidatus Rokubacteria bacterium]|nr:acyl-CoA dehydrogenase family protein [Candidatus Rokubacteria bacterium]
MPDFELTRAQDDLRRHTREIRDTQVVPFLERRGMDHALSADELKQLLRMTLPIGYPGAVVAKEDGGAGLDYVSLGIVIEELAPVFGFLAAHVVPRQIAMLGTPEQKRRYLVPLLAVDRLSTTAITEPDVGSDAGAIRMTARRAGDRYVLNGMKTWLTLGNIAETATVLVSTDPAAGSRGLSRIIVDLDHRRLRSSAIGTLGDRLIPFAEVTFEDYEVPVENRLGQEGEGFRLTLRAIQASRASMATHAVGIAQAAVDAAIAYAKQRTQFGRPIGGFQLVQGMLADMIAETEAARLLSYRAWAMMDHGRECSRESSIAKLYATEAAVRVTSKAIQIHGASGVSDRHPVGRYFRDARMLTFPDGTSEVHRLLIGRSALGIDAFR